MTSAIKDNRSRGKVGDFLKDCLKDGSTLSFVSAYFTIYAYDKLKDRLHKVDHLNFLYGDPRGVNNADPNKIEKKSFNIVDEKLALGNQLQQRCLAKACSDWIEEKVDIKSIKQSNLLHGKMYHIDDDGRKKALSSVCRRRVKLLSAARKKLAEGFFIYCEAQREFAIIITTRDKGVESLCQ